MELIYRVIINQFVVLACFFFFFFFYKQIIGIRKDRLQTDFLRSPSEREIRERRAHVVSGAA